MALDVAGFHTFAAQSICGCKNGALQVLGCKCSRNMWRFCGFVVVNQWGLKNKITARMQGVKHCHV
jgi:hypothetical protein